MLINKPYAFRLCDSFIMPLPREDHGPSEMIRVRRALKGPQRSALKAVRTLITRLDDLRASRVLIH